jgi:hypothetical protein
VFVGPESRHELGQLAASVYDEHFHGVDFWLMDHVIGPREHGAGDLLSYLFFDRRFIDGAIALGVKHAAATISRSAPWMVAHDLAASGARL